MQNETWKNLIVLVLGLFGAAFGLLLVFGFVSSITEHGWVGGIVLLSAGYVLGNEHGKGKGFIEGQCDSFFLWQDLLNDRRTLTKNEHECVGKLINEYTKKTGHKITIPISTLPTTSA